VSNAELAGALPGPTGHRSSQRVTVWVFCPVFVQVTEAPVDTSHGLGM